MHTSKLSASPEAKETSPGPRETGSFPADAFVVGAFLLCFGFVVLYTVGCFVVRLWR